MRCDGMWWDGTWVIPSDIFGPYEAWSLLHAALQHRLEHIRRHLHSNMTHLLTQLHSDMTTYMLRGIWWDVIWWDEMRWDEMRWDEMRWDRMGWNEADRVLQQFIHDFIAFILKLVQVDLGPAIIPTSTSTYIISIFTSLPPSIFMISITILWKKIFRPRMLCIIPPYMFKWIKCIFYCRFTRFISIDSKSGGKKNKKVVFTVKECFLFYHGIIYNIHIHTYPYPHHHRPHHITSHHITSHQYQHQHQFKISNAGNE